MRISGRQSFRTRQSGARGAGTRQSWLPDVTACLVIVVLAALSWSLLYHLINVYHDEFQPFGESQFATMRTDDGATKSHLGYQGYFWSERAFQFRYALLWATGNEQDRKRFEHDRLQQHPDGVNAYREYTLVMEPVYGTLYRLFGGRNQSFVEFLIAVIPLLHSLIFFLIYGVARALRIAVLPALLGVVIYASCSMGFARFSTSLLLKEDFALFWLMLFLMAHLHTLQRRRVAWLVLAAVALAVTVACWHLSQFLVTVLLLATATAHVVYASDRRWPWRAALVYVLAGLAAWLTPSLWERWFIVSLPMLALYAWILSWLLLRRWPILDTSRHRRLGVLAIVVCLCGAVYFFARPAGGDYGHVFGLLVNKLRFLFRRPVDPTALPFAVRVFWAAPFHAPGPAEIWGKLGYHICILLPGVAAALVLSFRARATVWVKSVLWAMGGFLLAYLCVERMGVVFLLLAAVSAAWLVDQLIRGVTAARSRSTGWLVQGAIAGLLLVTPLLNLGGNLRDEIQIARLGAGGQTANMSSPEEDIWYFRDELFRWIQQNTRGPRPGAAGSGRYGADAFLGNIDVSPQILLYTGRPVVLNSQFENVEIRRRYERYLQSLFSTREEVIWRFATEYQADYLFWSRNQVLNDGIGSARYLAGITTPLTMDMNIVRFQFMPESLQYFEPVYNNAYFRVLKVRTAAQVEAAMKQRAGAAAPERAPVVWERNFGLYWQLENFTCVDGELVDLAGDRRRLGQLEERLVQLQNALNSLLGRVEHDFRQRYPRIRPREPLPVAQRRLVFDRLEMLLAKSEAQRGQLQTTVSRRRRAIDARLQEIDPVTRLPLGTAIEGLLHHGPDGQTDQGWLPLLVGSVSEPTHHATMGQCLAMIGAYDQAADAFARAAGFFPSPQQLGEFPGLRPTAMQVRLWEETVWWCLGAQDIAQAGRLAALYAPLVRDYPRSHEFLQQVRQLSP